MVATSDTKSPSPSMTARIVAAFVGNNSLPRADLPPLIEAVHAELAHLAASGVAAAETPIPTPAVPVRKSITPDYLICLDDGLRFKSLKRHLANLGMTPKQYRAKWALPSDYPMVAPKYAAVRSALAKAMGLGQMRGARVPSGAAPNQSRSRLGRPRKVAA